MKKAILLLVAVIGITSFTFAQSLEIESYDVVTEVNSYGGLDYGAHASVKNVGTVDLNVLCKRIEYSQNSCAFDSSYFCWDLCYPASISQSFGGWLLKPGEVSDPNYFSAHVYAKNDGSTCIDSIRYVFFVEYDETDSVSVVLTYSSAPTFSVDEESKKVSNAYPNPARNYFFVELENQPNPNTTLEVYNLLGAKLVSVAVNEMKTEVNVSVLKSGIYLYTISENGVAIETKKFVVKK